MVDPNLSPTPTHILEYFPGMRDFETILIANVGNIAYKTASLMLF